MSSLLLKKYFHLYIFINIFFYTNSIDYNTSYPLDKEDCNNGYCLKIILYKNGSVIKECVDTKEYIDEKPYFSIVNEDKLLIYDCSESKIDSSCQYRLNNENNSVNLNSSSLENCRKKDTSDGNICCFFQETMDPTLSDNQTINFGCIEINEYEIERFIGINETRFDEYKKNNISNIGRLVCSSKIYQLNKLISLFILLFYIFH